MIFTLKQQNVKRNQVTAFHIIAALLLIAMGFITLVTPFSFNIFLAGKENTDKVPFGIVNIMGGIFMLIGIAIMIVSIFFNKRYIQKRMNLIIRIIEIICFGIILLFCLLQEWYLPAAYSGIALVGIILAYFLENMKYRVTTVSLEDNGISMKNNIKNTQWKWNQIEKFILKHNVITIQTLDKKMYQFIIEKDADHTSNEANTFAERKINEFIALRDNRDW